VGEAFAFRRGSRLVLSADNHNSVNGIREIARVRGAEVHYVPLDDELRLEGEERLLTPVTAPSLFAFPAQSNFSGVQHPLALVDVARRAGYAVLLDAAAFAPTNALRLDVVRPDFVALSFYKMFGYPTGVGALIVRREALAALERPWFAGGRWNSCRCSTARTCSRRAQKASRMARRTSARSPRWTRGSSC
jgi:selenocysteine lyase/cysteine desulfurase